MSLPWTGRVRSRIADVRVPGCDALGGRECGPGLRDAGRAGNAGCTSASESQRRTGPPPVAGLCQLHAGEPGKGILDRGAQGGVTGEHFPGAGRASPEAAEPENGHCYFVSETYPYATLVGAAELGYDTERPRYKRKPLRLPAAQWRAERAATCDTLIERLTKLADARHGLDRCQVLGLPARLTGDPAATMIVPARPEQRRGHGW